MSQLRRRPVHIALLIALPVLLGVWLRARMSWLPQVRQAYAKSVLRLAYSPNGKQLTGTGLNAQGHEQIDAFDASSLRFLKRLAFSRDNGTFSPNYELVAISSGGINDEGHPGLYSPNYKVQILDSKNHKQVWSLPFCPASNIEFSSSGQLLAAGADGCGPGSGSDYGGVALWRLKGRHLTQVSLSSDPDSFASGAYDMVDSLAFSPDETLLAVGVRNGIVKIRRTNDMGSTHELKIAGLSDDRTDFNNSAIAVAFSLNGSLLASSHAAPASSVCLWNSHSGKLLRTFKVSTKTTFALSFSPNSQTLACGSDDGAIQLFNVQTGARERRLKLQTPAPIRALAWSPDGATLASGDERGRIALWRVK